MVKALVLILVFGATFALVQALYVLFVMARGEKRAVNRRLSLLRNNDRRDIALEQLRRERWLGGSSEYGNLRRLVIQSGVRVNPLGLMVYYSCGAIIGTLIASLFLEHMALEALFGVIASAVIVYLYFLSARASRIATFAEQFPDAIDVMVRSLRAGHPVPRSLSLVAHEMPDPIGSEFGIASDELTYGSDLPRAMEALFARVGHPDLRFLVVAISVQRATGGSLADVLTNLSSVIRQRYKLRRKVRAITAEGRYSALVLSALPFVFLTLLNLVSADFYGEVWSDPMVPRALGVGAVMLVIGNFVMYRMVNYKV